MKVNNVLYYLLPGISEHFFDGSAMSSFLQQISVTDLGSALEQLARLLSSISFVLQLIDGVQLKN